MRICFAAIKSEKQKKEIKINYGKIKFSKNNINKKDIREVEKILKSGWLTHGKYSNYFEKEFSRFTGSTYSSLVSNCTAGLHLACKAMGFQKNDEVIVPAINPCGNSSCSRIYGG